MKHKFKKVQIKDTLMKAAGLSIGGAAAGAIEGVNFIAKMDSKTVAFVKIGLGALAPMILPKDPFLQSIADGIVAVGGYQLAHAFAPDIVPAIKGIGSNPPVVAGNRMKYYRQPQNVGSAGAMMQ